MVFIFKKQIFFTYIVDFHDDENEDYTDIEEYAEFDGGTFHHTISQHTSDNSNQLGGASSAILRPADSRSQSVFCMYLINSFILINNNIKP